jgi:DNA-directed RNA polymerase subunit RPC12/RpoP
MPDQIIAICTNEACGAGFPDRKRWQCPYCASRIRTLVQPVERGRYFAMSAEERAWLKLAPEAKGAAA